MASSVFQWCCYSPQSAIHNYSSSLVNSLDATCPRWSIVFPKKPPAAVTSSSSLLFRRRRRSSWNIDCLERRRMQSIIDTSWSSSPLLPSQISPWLMLPPELIKDQHDDDDDDAVANIVYKFYTISDDKVISFEGGDSSGREHLQLHNRGCDEFKGSSHGWLAQFDSWTNDLFLYNPISRRRLKLPTMDTLPLRGSPPRGAAVDFNDTDKLSECLVTKVVLSSWDPEKDESCVAMMLYGSDNRLAYCHPAQGTRAKWCPLGSDRHWVWDDSGCERWARSYQDIAYSAREKLFFCITKEPRVELEAWDSMALLGEDMPISNKEYFEQVDDDYYPWPRRCEREFHLKGLCTKRQRYLVVAEPYCRGGDHNGGLPSQQLFLVLRHRMRLWDGVYSDDDDAGFPIHSPLHTVAFDVHRFDVRTRKLVYMDRTLDGLALFVGKNHSFAVEASGLDRLKPNSIYFTDSEHPGGEDVDGYVPKDYGGHDMGIYHYESATFSSCYYPCQAESIKRIVPAPMWFSPYQSK